MNQILDPGQSKFDSEDIIVNPDKIICKVWSDDGFSPNFMKVNYYVVWERQIGYYYIIEGQNELDNWEGRTWEHDFG